MTPYICSHTRSGTHYLAKLLHQNLETGITHYESLHYSHSRPYLDGPYIHLYRPLEATLRSMFQVRDQLGINRRTDWEMFLRQEQRRMLVSMECSGTLNGERDDRLRPAKVFPWTLPERWLHLNLLFHRFAAWTVDYDFVTTEPIATCMLVANVFGLTCKPGMRSLSEKVGWARLGEPEHIPMTEEDRAIIAKYQRIYDEAVRSPAR